MIVDRLYDRVKKRGHVCLGLDTDYSYIPKKFAEKFATEGEAIFRFNKSIIDLTCDIVACYKVQIAYYEALGLEGLEAYSKTLSYIKHIGCIAIADVKRNDIMKTAEMYAKGHFEGDFEADFITLNTYMGVNDSLEPYLDYIDNDEKGIFVLVRTSNSGAKDFQYIEDKNGVPLYENVGEKLEQLAECHMGKCGYSSIGAVVGLTNNENALELRGKISKMFLLIPGYGAQGGKAEDIAQYMVDGNGAVVNSSRGILLAYKKEKYAEQFTKMEFALAARHAVIDMRDDIRNALQK